MYQKMNLKYGYEDLEPVIDSKTVNIHYNKHYQKYLDNLNKVLQELNYDFKYSVVELVKHIDEFPIDKRDTILFNAGGVINHELYFNSMTPHMNQRPVGELKKAIDETYGNYENFKQEFIKTASYLVGSGYTFLVMNKENELEIINTSNQETPYLYGLTPILALDLWEHAFYLKYQNRKDEYINNFFSIIDFENVSKLHEQKKEV